MLKTKDGFVLVDSGTAKQWEKLDALLKEAGCTPDNLKLMIVTHGDGDHIGNCKKVRDKYKVKIAMHKEDLKMAEVGIMPERTSKILIVRLLMFFQKLGKRKPSFETFTPDILLGDGQNLTEYGLDATIHHIPGHTKGSIAILTKEGIIVGDTLTNMSKPNTAMLIENQEDYKRSIEKLKRLDFQKAYVGHGNAFDRDVFMKIVQ
jgi:hydroxyacylglutathione hydrolase